MHLFIKKTVAYNTEQGLCMSSQSSGTEATQLAPQ